jgi:hypothetical protein
MAEKEVSTASDSKSEKGDMPRPEHNDFPKLEWIRNRRSQSRQKSLKPQTEEEQEIEKPSSVYFIAIIKEGHRDMERYES